MSNNLVNRLTLTAGGETFNSSDAWQIALSLLRGFTLGTRHKKIRNILLYGDIETDASESHVPKSFNVFALDFCLITVDSSYFSGAIP